MNTGILIITMTILVANLGEAEDRPVPYEFLPAHVGSVISNRWLTGVDGELRKLCEVQRDLSPFIVNMVTNSLIATLMPITQFYRVEVLRVRGTGRFCSHDKATVVVDGKKRVSIIETDESAIAFINNLVYRGGSPFVRAVENVAAFSELRCYAFATAENLRSISAKSDSCPLSNSSSIMIRNSDNEIFIAAMFATILDLPVIKCMRYEFCLKPTGQMYLMRVEEAGSVGGYM